MDVLVRMKNVILVGLIIALLFGFFIFGMIMIPLALFFGIIVYVINYIITGDDNENIFG